MCWSSIVPPSKTGWRPLRAIWDWATPASKGWRGGYWSFGHGFGIPHTLVEIGVPSDAAARLAPMALVDSLVGDQPGDADDAGSGVALRERTRRQAPNRLNTSPANHSRHAGGASALTRDLLDWWPNRSAAMVSSTPWFLRRIHPRPIPAGPDAAESRVHRSGRCPGIMFNAPAATSRIHPLQTGERTSWQARCPYRTPSRS